MTASRVVSMIKQIVVTAALGAALASSAGAATIGFDALPDEGAQLDSYSENGISATAIGGVLAYEGVPGFAHVDDSGTGLTSGIDFTMAGLFDAVEFSLVSYGFSFSDPDDQPGPLADNILVTGYQGATATASASFLLSDIFGTVQTFLLGPAFSGLSRLTIEILYPQTTAYCDAPCGHFDLDYVTLNPNGPAPVPLPASGLLLMAGGVGLAALRRRRRA